MTNPTQIRNILDTLGQLNENSLSPKELSMSKHNGQYIETLIRLASDGPVEVDPPKRAKLGDTVSLTPATIKALSAVFAGVAELPAKPMFILSNGQQVMGSWNDLYKSTAFTTKGASGEQKKKYNAGHLAELFMGLAISAKFFNFGKPITSLNVLDMFGHAKITNHINPATMKETSGIKFELSRPIANTKSNPGQTNMLTFIAVTLGLSAKEFINLYNAQTYPKDIQSVLASAVMFVNESDAMADAVDIVNNSPKGNQISVVADGTSDAKGTKADLVLSIDGTQINLLSLKTYGSNTIGQNSGTEYETLAAWFKHGFDLDIKKYKDKFDEKLPVREVIDNIFEIYDNVVYPAVVKKLAKQTPDEDSDLVKDLAKAANFRARGEKLEDVTVVKLDDTLSTGSYKVMKFSDDLYDAMKKLKLYADITKGTNGRTIVILVKPVAEIKFGEKWKNILCQFRSQITGGYLRNYFEIGDVMVELANLPKSGSAKKDLAAINDDDEEMQIRPTVSQVDQRKADIATGKSMTTLRPKGAANAAEKMARKASPSAPRARR